MKNSARIQKGVFHAIRCDYKNPSPPPLDTDEEHHKIHKEIDKWKLLKEKQSLHGTM